MKSEIKFLPVFLLTACAVPVASSPDASMQGSSSRGSSDQGADPLAKAGEYLDANGIRLRRRAGGAHELAQPAQINVVKATGTPNSQVSVDAGLNWQADFLQFSQALDLSVLFEMHKNTAFPFKQESYLFGFMGTTRLNDSDDFQVVLDTTLALKTDKYTERGLFAKGLAAFVIPEWGAGKLHESEHLAWQWLPQIGLLYENASRVVGNRNIPRGTHGDALSLVATVGADAFPWPATFDRRLRVHTELTYWGQVLESGGFKASSDNEHQFRAVIDYALDQSRSIYAGVEYGSGGNPEIGLRPEDYVMFHLSLMAGGLN